jgi:hypothetical protein
MPRRLRVSPRATAHESVDGVSLGLVLHRMVDEDASEPGEAVIDLSRVHSPGRRLRLMRTS